MASCLLLFVLKRATKHFSLSKGCPLPQDKQVLVQHDSPSRGEQALFPAIGGLRLLFRLPPLVYFLQRGFSLTVRRIKSF